MILSEAIENANRLALSLHGLRLRCDLRSRVAAACFAVAQQHHNSILILLRNQPPLNATAFGLLRLLSEATIRGQWLSHCATDAEVSKFVDLSQRLNAKSMINAICESSTLDIDESSSGKLYDFLYKIPCSYTHTGELQIQRWLRTQDIEPTYSDAEVSELLSLSNHLANFAAAGTKNLVSEHS